MDEAKIMVAAPTKVWYVPRMVSVVEVFIKKRIRVGIKVEAIVGGGSAAAMRL